MSRPTRIFLISPAHTGGKRAALLFRESATFELATQLRATEGVSLGEVFSFVSGLYFRGKLAYARAFGHAAAGAPSALVITTARGLVPADKRITLIDLAEFASIPIDRKEPRYWRPLAADAERLRASLPNDAELVLLGSVATSKYVELLLEVFGGRLCFPEAFVGMGDMQRGALLLRSAQAGTELKYISALGAIRSRAVQRVRVSR
jgi:hypothetical protein